MDASRLPRGTLYRKKLLPGVSKCKCKRHFVQSLDYFLNISKQRTERVHPILVYLKAQNVTLSCVSSAGGVGSCVATSDTVLLCSRAKIYIFFLKKGIEVRWQRGRNRQSL
jgi:hypothetical protein